MYCFDYIHLRDIQMYCLNNVMLRMFNPSVVGHRFNLQTGQTKDYKISIFSFSAKLTALKSVINMYTYSASSFNVHLDYYINISCMFYSSFDRF